MVWKNLKLGNEKCAEDYRSAEELIPNCRSEKNFLSQCLPILESIRNFSISKRTEDSRGEMIVYNYFDKQLIDKRSTFFYM